MKNLYSLKNLLLAACVSLAGAANAQTSHPLTFPQDAVTPATYIYSNNYYKDYVGLRFQVSAPASIAGNKAYTATYDYSDTTLTSNWGGAPRDFIDSPVKFGPVGDTAGCTPYPSSTYFAGKIAIVWRGDCEFGAKALAAQNAGAVACIIVNNVSGGPVGMAAGAAGAGVHIPVYMISQNDGMDITAQLAAGQNVKMTILIHWGVGNHNDLGFVPNGYSTGAANYAMPLAQMMASSHPDAYKNINGAFIANYGLHNATNVVLHSDLSFTPTGGATSLVYADSVVYNNNAAIPVSPTPTTFRPIDSLVAMFGPRYNLPTVASTGRFDLKYTITSDSTDAFAADNTYTSSFYATDNLYSKGRYDFSKNEPISTFYTGPGGTPASPYIWGTPFFIANGGSVIKTVQFSVSNGVGALPSIQLPVYVFKWTDTLGGGADSLIENTELELVGTGLKGFDGVNDSSFKTFTVAIGDTINSDSTHQVVLDGNSWYVIAPEVPAGWAMGLDGLTNGYPRSYGLKHFNNYFESYNPLYVGNRSTDQFNGPNDVWSPIAFREVGVGVNNLLNVDSVVYSSQAHLLPSIAFTISNHYNSVTVPTAAFAKINLYPNPATDNINVSVSLDAVAEQLTYTIINTAGQFVSKEIHKNVQNEVYNLSTAKLAAGTYYVIVSSGSHATSKKFTVIK